MPLFASRACFEQADICKAGLITVLLIVSASLQAALPEDDKNNLQINGEQPQNDQASAGKPHDFHFPHWPQRKREQKEIIPPPPPGPYMSSALSDYSIRAPSFRRDPNKYEQRKSARRYSPATPMDIFSPDIPWPKDLRPGQNKPSNRWMPDNGYHYVQPKHGKKVSPATRSVTQPPVRYGPQSGRNYGFGNNQGPRMNSMNMNGSRWVPSMGITRQGGPYAEMPNSGTNNRLNTGPQYGRPVMNKNGMNAANPPYPQPGRPRHPNQGL